MENEQIINRRTPVRIQRWTMEGMRGLDTVPLEDVLTCLRSNIKGTEDHSSYSIKLATDLDCRLFSLTENILTIDEIKYKTENDEPIEDMIMSKGNFGAYINKRKFSVDNFLEDCGFDKDSIPEIKKTINTYEQMRKDNV